MAGTDRRQHPLRERGTGAAITVARPKLPASHAARHRREARRSWTRLDEISGLLDARAQRAPHRLAHRGRLQPSG